MDIGDIDVKREFAIFQNGISFHPRCKILFFMFYVMEEKVGYRVALVYERQLSFATIAIAIDAQLANNP